MNAMTLCSNTIVKRQVKFKHYYLIAYDVEKISCLYVLG